MCDSDVARSQSQHQCHFWRMGSMFESYCTGKWAWQLSIKCMSVMSLWTSALDKLLGQLGIYATWLSSIAYLQKQLRIFIYFFTPHFFSVNSPFSYSMKQSGMCLHIYILPSPAFLKYQTCGFYCTWSKSDPLVDIQACITLQSFTFIIVFFCEILDWAPIFS